jgi:hypothetical protein
MESKFKYPKFETKNAGMFNAITTIENRFLQEVVNMKAMVCFISEFTIFAESSLAMFKVVDDDTIYLECISTPASARKQGSATKVMKAFIEAANLSKTKITLFACNVTGNGWQMMQHMVIAHGMAKKNKIPVQKLKSWYESFGFKVVSHDKKRKGWHMEYIPQ